MISDAGRRSDTGDYWSIPYLPLFWKDIRVSVYDVDLTHI